MTALVSQDLGIVFDTLADAIEGGNTWRGSGDAMQGIPGAYSTDEEIHNGNDDTMTVSYGVSTTQWQMFQRWHDDRWTPAKAPGLFVLDPHGEHRKITVATWAAGSGPHPAHVDATTFTVASAFTNTVETSDVLTVLQGFKRAPNWEDLDSDSGAADGFDRFFSLSALPGKRSQWMGSGSHTYQTDMRLRLRLAKKGRMHDWTASVITNIGILRSALPKTTHYNSTYMRALIAGEDEIKIVKEDSRKIVAEDTYKLFYRLDTTFA